MPESKRLTKKQSAVIEDLFAGKLQEQAILEKHHVGQQEYDRWLVNERFMEGLEARIAAAYRQSRLILARSASEVATKLVELATGEKGETTRKACLDIIALYSAGHRPSESTDAEHTRTIPALASLSPEVASRLLAALARDEPQAENDSQ